MEKKPTKPKKEKSKIKPTIELVSYSISAVIPTMLYGNIQPTITVKAGTIAEASFYALDHINWLFKTYMEDPRDGKLPRFMQNIEVKKAEPMTPPTSPKAPEAPKNEPQTPMSEAFTKAKKAIDNCMSIDATQIIEDQIQKSVKLSLAEKPILLEAILLKRKDLNGKGE